MPLFAGFAIYPAVCYICIGNYCETENSENQDETTNTHN